MGIVIGIFKYIFFKLIFNKEGWSQYSDHTSHSDSHKGKEQNPDGLEGHKGKKRLEE